MCIIQPNLHTHKKKIVNGQTDLHRVDSFKMIKDFECIGNTPLLLAYIKGNVELCEALVNNGAILGMFEQFHQENVLNTINI